jgi:hypothetical protein
MANEFSKYANAIAMRESALQSQLAGLSNMSSSVQNVAASTGAPSAINPGEVPSVSGLASMQAGMTDISKIRAKQEGGVVRNLPKYVSAYNNYLRWRYPTRYGSGGSGSTASNPYGDYDVPQLPGLSGNLPGMK